MDIETMMLLYSRISETTIPAILQFGSLRQLQAAA